MWKVPSPAIHSSDGFLPGTSTISPLWRWFLLGRFIHNSITFEEGSARGMVCSRCSQGPRVGPEECIFLSHLHTGNWSNFQSRLCFATAHQVNIVMIYTIYSHPLTLSFELFTLKAVRSTTHIWGFNDISSLLKHIQFECDNTANTNR